MKESIVPGVAAPTDSMARLSLRGRGHGQDGDAGTTAPLAEAQGRSHTRSPSTHPKGAVDRTSAAALRETPQASQLISSS